MRMAIGLTFPGALKDECVLCYLCKNYDITLNIIEASFSMASGWSIIEVEGSEEELRRAFEYLVKKNIRIQKIETKKDEPPLRQE